jgi:hypothetical protein
LYMYVMMCTGKKNGTTARMCMASASRNTQRQSVLSPHLTSTSSRSRSSPKNHIIIPRRRRRQIPYLLSTSSMSMSNLFPTSPPGRRLPRILRKHYPRLTNNSRLHCTRHRLRPPSIMRAPSCRWRWNDRLVRRREHGSPWSYCQLCSNRWRIQRRDR